LERIRFESKNKEKIEKGEPLILEDKDFIFFKILSDLSFQIKRLAGKIK